MRSLLRNNRGAAAVEFALVAVPIIWFILGIIQTGWIVWSDNLLHISVDTAARCGAIGSTTPPCSGSSLQNMRQTAGTVFGPLSGATFTANSGCSDDGGAGLIGTYNITVGFVINLTLTAQSCYPTPSA